jgi:predicted alpha-1,2-mannosidase
MKKIIYCFAFFALLTHAPVFAQSTPATTNLIDYVNPLMGTQSKFSLSSGNTYPAIALPWGMNFWMPQTGKMGDGWSYMYDAEKIRGFKQTHQPSPWINDYGQFSVMPMTSLKIDENDRASWFSHKAETVKPNYYKVYLADYDVTTEITPTERAAQFRFTFPKSDSSYVLLDAFDRGSYVKIIPSERKIIGYTTKNSGGVPANFKNYFVLVFDKSFKFSSAWNNKKIAQDTLEVQANHVGAIVRFETKAGEKIGLKVASSFISYEQAERNMATEIGKDTFDQTQEKGRKIWNQELSRITVEGDNIDEIRTFYSCLYRVLLFPRKFYEFDAKGKVVHYSPYNGEVRPGYMFTDNGFWDTFRAVFPYFTLMYPTMNAQIMEGLANAYDESGFLPEWASPGHRDCMIGSNSASLIADSYVKGIRGYDINKLYEAIIKNTNNAGPVSSVGRFGHDYYNKLGYVPYDVKINENAARTLEYAYADFCISQLAKELKKPQAEIDLYLKRTQNYRNLFDPQTKWMRGKNEDGKFQTPFNPFKWGDAFTEGNSIHYTWSVFQDVKGLVGLMGGREAFVQKLDSVFTMPPIFDDSYYGFPIHEIREMQIMNMGNYAHGNQPIQHMIYLYNYAGAPSKAQYWSRQVMKRMYQPTPDGYCGDEDNGQTSAWYVFSSLGFYPVTPGTTQYVIGSPLFKKATLTMEDGKKFTIESSKNSATNLYIDGATMNGKSYGNTYLEHKDIQNGGTLQFNMTSTPSKSWGIKPEVAPFSLTK